MTAAAETWSVVSPNGAVDITVAVDTAGRPTYTVAHDGVVVVASSRLGVERLDASFTVGLVSDACTPADEIDETYDLVHGKQRRLRHRARERRIEFVGSNGEPFRIVLRAYDEGVAFRYVFPVADDETATITEESTSFAFSEGGSAWIQPAQVAALHAPAYENLFEDGIPIGSRAPGPGWNMPALFHTSNRWVMLAESDLDRSYAGARLAADPDRREYRIAFPQAAEGGGVGEVAPSHRRPWTLPWRAILVATDLSSIFESSIVTHLSRPATVPAPDWVVPGRVSWSWWSDAESPQNLEALCAYVDLAADMGWEHTLVDANWTVHSEEAIQAFVGDARAKGVGVFLWYNSGGPNNHVSEAPRDRMFERDIRRAEMRKLQSWGVSGVKVDFLHSEKQAGIGLIQSIVEDALDHQLMVNFHGCTIPRGWTRRWPNLLTMEAVRGAEQYGFDPDYPAVAPAHNTILALTRNVIGPMDYTPVTIGDSVYPHVTTATHELALAVVFESGLLHLADSADSYRRQRAEVVDYLRTVPARWDETRLLAGDPGRFVAVARRDGAAWYVGAISGLEDDFDLDVPLAFLDRGGYALLKLCDGSFRDDVAVDEKTVSKGDVAHLRLAPYGGGVMRLTPLGDARER